MKRLLYIFLISLYPLLALPKGFVIKGSIEGVKSGTVSLEYAKADGEDTTITAPITGGTFTLAGVAAEPELVRLSVSGEWSYSISFFLENTDMKIQLVKDAPQRTLISGSMNEVVYSSLKPQQMKFFEQARQNEAAHQQAAGTRNNAALRSADSLWNAQQQDWVRTIRASIDTKAGYYASLYFTRWLLFRPLNYDTIRALFMKLPADVRKGPSGKKFLTEFEHLYISSPGQPAPEVSGTDTAGKAHTLAALKGKVVLLDFWASYCGPCRQENKRMIPVYEKYRATGFEILSFSLDSQRPAWVQAIQTDGMLWPQVSELRGGASATANTYNISDLPRNVLIDRSGKIYAKDLHGEELIQIIEGLVKKK